MFRETERGPLVPSLRMYGIMIWFDHMKTTLNLDDDVLERAKRLAAAEGITLTALVEDALRARMIPKPRGRHRFRLQLPTVKGAAPPDVDVADRNALLDYLDEHP